MCVWDGVVMEREAPLLDWMSDKRLEVRYINSERSSSLLRDLEVIEEALVNPLSRYQQMVYKPSDNSQPDLMLINLEQELFITASIKIVGQCLTVAEKNNDLASTMISGFGNAKPSK